MTVTPFHPSSRARDTGGRPPARRGVPLLDLDPELGRLLAGERLAAARRELLAPVVGLARGEWAARELAVVRDDHVGLLVLDGVIAREVVLEDTTSTELLGPGDLLRPRASERPVTLLPRHVRWQVLADARLALLTYSFGQVLLRFPEVNAMLMERLAARCERIATAKAIAELNSVERRLLALFWHLAEEWGRVTPDGVLVPLTLSHRLLGELVGARRPTVSTAIMSLARDGKLRRRHDGAWLITADRAGERARDSLRVIPHRRRVLVDEELAAPG